MRKDFHLFAQGRRVFTMVRVEEEEDQLKIEKPGGWEELLTTLQAGEMCTNFEKVKLNFLLFLLFKARLQPPILSSRQV